GDVLALLVTEIAQSAAQALVARPVERFGSRYQHGDLPDFLRRLRPRYGKRSPEKECRQPDKNFLPHRCRSARKNSCSAADFARNLELFNHPAAPGQTPPGRTGTENRFADRNRRSSRPPHRITLSARASTLGGIVRPICLAAFRFTTNSNFVGCSTGRSAGLAPLRILST